MTRGDELQPPAYAWVTNVAAPYRLPVWQSIAERSRLVVYLLESDQHISRAGRRGVDWRAAQGTGYRIAHLRVVPISRGENARFLAREAVGLRVSRARSVLLGGWDSPVYWQILFVAKLRSRRVVAFYESTLATNQHTSGPIARIRSAFFRSVDAVVVPGPAAAEAVLSFGVPTDRIHVGFNAVDVERFHRGAVESRRDEGAPPGNRFIYVGQMIDRKRVDVLFRAFARLDDPTARLTVVGSGAAEVALRALAVELGVDGRIEMIPFVPNENLPELLARHATLVLPSAEEVWGLVVNEALAAGLQAVVSRTCGVAASVDGMRGVHLCDPVEEDLVRALRLSIDSWDGPISEPQILNYTPERFAKVFVEALRI